jgi:hypothetical protein
MGWVVNSTPRPLYPRERDPVPIVYDAGWAPGPVWTAAKNLAPTGIRSPDRRARSESLYRLSYPGPLHIYDDSHLTKRPCFNPMDSWWRKWTCDVVFSECPGFPLSLVIPPVFHTHSFTIRMFASCSADGHSSRDRLVPLYVAIIEQ